MDLGILLAMSKRSEYQNGVERLHDMLVQRSRGGGGDDAEYSRLARTRSDRVASNQLEPSSMGRAQVIHVQKVRHPAWAAAYLLT